MSVSDETPERGSSRNSSPRPPTDILWDEDEPLDPLPDPEESLRHPMYKALYEHWRYEEPSPTPEQDPSKNPAIPLEDLDDSIPKRRRLRFFDLEEKIRNEVYKQLLTPKGGFPMDFASCADCAHERGGYKGVDAYDPDEPCEGITWFASEWRKIRERLLNLAVSKQFYAEAIEVFYGQPFRFTGDCGWIMLFHFLVRLGVQNRWKLKDITVCHPGLSSSPLIYTPQQRNAPPEDGDSYDVFNEHMRAFGFGPVMWKGSFPSLSHEDPESERWTSTNAEADDMTVRLLGKVANLTNLTLTLPQFQFPDEQYSFDGLEQCVIHQYAWPQGEQLTRSILHLVSSRHACSDASRFQPCMAEIYGLPQTKELKKRVTNLHGYIPNGGGHPDRTMEASRPREAHRFFEAVKAQGWEVKEVYYDERGHYPVKSEEGCVNKSMCDLLRKIDAPDLGYECPGNTDKEVLHWGAPRFPLGRPGEAGIGGADISIDE